jgi:hypothetical protein
LNTRVSFESALGLQVGQFSVGVNTTYTLTELLQEVGLPRSSYFYHRARLEVADKYVEVRRAMSDIFESNYRCYGYRRCTPRSPGSR